MVNIMNYVIQAANLAIMVGTTIEQARAVWEQHTALINTMMAEKRDPTHEEWATLMNQVLANTNSLNNIADDL